MDEFKEMLKERSISFWFRTALRVLAWGVLCFLIVYKIIFPVLAGEKLNIGRQEAYIMLMCISLILVVEAVRQAFLRFWDNKNKSK